MNNKIDYENLTEITVKSQKELDDIPESFKGRIYIEFGSPGKRAIVSKKYVGSVEARENSSVVARGNSFVEARENSSVVALGNSSVVALGNTQVVDFLMKDCGRIQISGNARVVHNPKTIHEYLDFYGIKHDKKKVTLYKAVKKYADGTYHSSWDFDFTYTIEKKAKSKLDKDVNEDCGSGIHISHLAWAVDFGRDWDNLAILEVEADIDSIIVPLSGNGKVRTNEVTVIREVPLEECGLLGKMLAKRRGANK